MNRYYLNIEYGFFQRVLMPHSFLFFINVKFQLAYIYLNIGRIIYYTRKLSSLRDDHKSSGPLLFLSNF